jgi:membrane protease YdiL (CAAX protease family)
MDQLWLSNLSKLAIPVVAIGVLLVIARVRKFSMREDIGFQRFAPGQAALFLAFWVALIAVEEFVGTAFGAGVATPWPAFPIGIIIIRVLAIGILGPISEEMAWRGFAFFFLRKKVGAAGAILIPALIWAALHTQYGLPTLAIIFVDGLVLGCARYKTGSIWVPIGLHICGNLFSIYQSLQ